MTSLQKIGGLSGILAGVILLLSFIVYIPALASAPPELYQAGNVAFRLSYFGSITDTQKLIFTVSPSLNIVSLFFMIPALLALYSTLKDHREGYSLLASVLAVIAVPFLIIVIFNGYTIVWLGESFAAASSVEKPILVSIYGLSERLSSVSEKVFWLFFGAAAIIYYFAMLGVFSRWIRALGFAMALLGFMGFVPQLDLLLLPADLLLIVWFISVGVMLYRGPRGLRA